MANTPNCQHCRKPMQVNKYQKTKRSTEVYTFACYACGTVNIKTFGPEFDAQRRVRGR